MNSLSDREFDQKLDRLLAETVGPGAAPEAFSLACLPRRPRFSWVPAGVVMICICGLGALVCIWFSGLPVQQLAASLPGESLAGVLTAGIMACTESLSSAEAMIYAAAFMAAVYFYCGRRLIRLFLS